MIAIQLHVLKGLRPGCWGCQQRRPRHIKSIKGSLALARQLVAYALADIVVVVILEIIINFESA